MLLNYNYVILYYKNNLKLIVKFYYNEVYLDDSLDLII